MGLLHGLADVRQILVTTKLPSNIYSQANCDVLSDIKVYATGGDGAETQYCQFNYLVAQSKAHQFE